MGWLYQGLEDSLSQLVWGSVSLQGHITDSYICKGSTDQHLDVPSFISRYNYERMSFLIHTESQQGLQNQTTLHTFCLFGKIFGTWDPKTSRSASSVLSSGKGSGATFNILVVSGRQRISADPKKRDTRSVNITFIFPPMRTADSVCSLSSTFRSMSSYLHIISSVFSGGSAVYSQKYRYLTILKYAVSDLLKARALFRLRPVIPSCHGLRKNNILFQIFPGVK